MIKSLNITMEKENNNPFLSFIKPKNRHVPNFTNTIPSSQIRLHQHALDTSVCLRNQKLEKQKPRNKQKETSKIL